MAAVRIGGVCPLQRRAALVYYPCARSRNGNASSASTFSDPEAQLAAAAGCAIIHRSRLRSPHEGRPMSDQPREN